MTGARGGELAGAYIAHHQTGDETIGDQLGNHGNEHGRAGHAGENAGQNRTDYAAAKTIPAAADQFKRWVFSKGKKLAGLEKRRNLEYRLFIGETINDLELDRLIDTIREEIKYITGAAKKEEYDQILKYLLEDKILRERLNRIMGCKNDL